MTSRFGVPRSTATPPRPLLKRDVLCTDKDLRIIHILQHVQVKVFVKPRAEWYAYALLAVGFVKIFMSRMYKITHCSVYEHISFCAKI